MKIKVWLFISALCINTAWAAAVDSNTMAPTQSGVNNSGAYSTIIPKTTGWVRMVDRTHTNCYTTGDYTGGGGKTIWVANFLTGSHTDGEVDGGTMRCAKGYVAIGAYFDSNITSTGSTITSIHNYLGTRCCPLKWYLMDQSTTEPDITTISTPTTVPPNAAAPDLN